MSTINVVDASNNVQTVNTLPSLGAANTANSLPMTFATDGVLPLPTGAATATGVIAAANAIIATLGNPLQANGTIQVGNFPTTQSVSGNVSISIAGVAISNSAPLPISVSTLPLPAGAASNTGLAAIVTTLGTPLQAGGSVNVSNLPATQAISAAALPLPTGAALEAGGNLASLNTKVVTTANGIKIDGSATTQPISASGLPLPAGAATSVGVTAAANSIITALGTPLQANGTINIGTIAGIATDSHLTNVQSAAGTSATTLITVQGSATGVAQPISAATLPLPTGAASNTGLTTIVTTLGSPLQAGGTVSVSNLPTTQAISAAALPLPTGAGTDASLQQILTAIKAQIDITSQIWYDPTTLPVTYYIRRESLNEGTGTVTVTWYTPSGATATPTVSNLVAVSNSQNIIPETVIYTATSSGTGYASGDILIHTFGVDTAITSNTVSYQFWLNAGPSSTGVISAPTNGTYVQTTQPVSLTVSGAALASNNPLPVNGTINTVVQGTAVDRGTVIGFTGATFTTVSANSTVTLVTAPTNGSIQLGMILTNTATPVNTYLYSLSSGTLNVTGSTYALSSSANTLVTVNATANGTFASTSVGPQQIMPANSSRRGLSYQNQSSTGNIWVNGVGSATPDFHSLKLTAGVYYESAPQHVGTGAVAAISDTAGISFYAREF